MDQSDIDLTVNGLRRLRPLLRKWHRRNGRELPWRNCRDPYKVWISEIMLQQTTVAAVKPYYERFMQRFPDVTTLANAPEQDVLRLWEGLGYYSRARNLHRAAQAIREDGGRFPETVGELLRLPGIGRYTAGAIVSFAFNCPAPIVEANTLRLYCRLLGFRGDPRSAAGQRLLWKFAEEIVPSKSPADFHQTLMDLGATVCTPTVPECFECPLAPTCRAFAEQIQADIPQLPQRVAVTELHEAYIAIRRRGRYLIHRRADGERWAGLWDFPRLSISEENRSREKKQIADLERGVADQFRLTVRIAERLTQLKHCVTRFRITLDCWRAEYSGLREVTTLRDAKWVTPTEFANFPFSMTGRKLANLLLDETTARP